MPIHEIQEAFSKRSRPAYSTIQTTVYRLEGKKTLRRIRKINHAHIFEASISRGKAQGRLIDDLLSLFGDRLQPVMAHLVESTVLAGHRNVTLDSLAGSVSGLIGLGHPLVDRIGLRGGSISRRPGRRSPLPSSIGCVHHAAGGGRRTRSVRRRCRLRATNLV